jgi:hypothetical protein
MSLWKPPALARALALCLLLAPPAVARASEHVQFSASFDPNRPRVSTTITFAFTITGSEGQVPPPLRNVDLHLPGGIGLGRTSLGTAICEPVYLYEEGPEGCPANSHVGYGTAQAEVPYGPEIVQEHAAVYAYRGNSEHEHITILFLAEARSPVFADLVFPGQILEDKPPYSASIDTEVPLVPSLPGGPDVSVVQFQSTFGPKHLIYEREINGQTVYFHPRGVTLPSTCPPGGYPFAADFTFKDETHQTVYAKSPCPPTARSRARTPIRARARRRRRPAWACLRRSSGPPSGSPVRWGVRRAAQTTPAPRRSSRNPRA